MFMSPEIAISNPWRDLFSSKLQLSLLAIDEAHCVYEWLVSIKIARVCWYNLIVCTCM